MADEILDVRFIDGGGTPLAGKPTKLHDPHWKKIAGPPAVIAEKDGMFRIYEKGDSRGWEALYYFEHTDAEGVSQYRRKNTFGDAPAPTP